MGFLTRRSGPVGPLLEWRVRLLLAGGVLSAAGILLDERWLTGLAIVVLGAGVLIRLLPSDRDGQSPEDSDDE